MARLELEKYKATIKGLTQFGDRREGTQRNRDAVDWIEAQLKSYGYTNTERVTLPIRRQSDGRRAGAAQACRPVPRRPRNAARQRAGRARRAGRRPAAVARAGGLSDRLGRQPPLRQSRPRPA